MQHHDFHLHTRFSADARDEPRAFCLRAMERGYAAICFTDHADFERADFGYGYLQYEAYRAAVEECRAEFQGRLRVFCGVEIDYHHSWEDEIREYLADKDFDFILGSVHYLDDHVIVMEDRHFAGKTQRAAYEEYFAEVLRLVEAGFCHAVGHLDLIKRKGAHLYGSYAAEAYRDSLDPIFRTMIRRDTALEINLSGYRQGLGCPLPGLDAVGMYAEAGGRFVTVGSDAHQAKDACPEAEEVWRYLEGSPLELWTPCN